jgi:hypothetical protein
MMARAAALVAAVLLTCLQAGPTSAGGSGGVAGRVRASPISVSLALSTSTARVGDKVQAQASVANLTKAALTSVVVELRVDLAGLRIKPPNSQALSVKAGRTATGKWSVCGMVPGSYVIVARATVGGIAVDSPGHVLTVTPANRKSSC